MLFLGQGSANHNFISGFYLKTGFPPETGHAFTHLAALAVIDAIKAMGIEYDFEVMVKHFVVHFLEANQVGIVAQKLFDNELDSASRRRVLT